MYCIGLVEVVAAGEDERLLLQVGVQRLHQRPAQGLAHRAALFGGLAGDLPLDFEQLIDPSHHLQGVDAGVKLPRTAV